MKVLVGNKIVEAKETVSKTMVVYSDGKKIRTNKGQKYGEDTDMKKYVALLHEVDTD